MEDKRGDQEWAVTIRRVARAALSLVGAALITATANADCQKSIACGTTIAGQLNILGNSCLDANALTYDLYPVNLAIGQRLSVSASSPSFPPQLIVLDDTNTQRAADLNPARTASASTAITVDRDGVWTIMLRNSDISGDGPYSLSLSCGAIPPPPPQNGFVLSAAPPSVTLGRSASFTATIRSAAFGNFASDVTVTPTGIPADFTVTPNAAMFVAGVGSADFKVTIGDSARDGLASIIFTGAATDGTIARASIVVTVDAPCSPPFLLPQTNSAQVIRGSRATLAVKPGGSQPFSYQWYSGPSGSVVFPAQDGRAAAYTTPALVSDEQFWVRVSNECGSRDSDTMTVRVLDSPPKHRSVRH